MTTGIWMYSEPFIHESVRRGLYLWIEVYCTVLYLPHTLGNERSTSIVWYGWVRDSPAVRVVSSPRASPLLSSTCLNGYVKVNGEKIAVLIVDTQGLFDNETTMLLTSCIFGLSTLMSSHQVPSGRSG